MSFSLLKNFQNPSQKDFLYKIFSTNQNSRKIRKQLLDLLLIRIDGRVNTDPVNVVFTFVDFSKSVSKGFSVKKFFDQSEFEKKSNLIIGVLGHWERRRSEH